MKRNYKPFIEDNFKIINKELQEVPFIYNPIQASYDEMRGKRDIILKARQQGFSSEILAEYTTDFLMMDNSISVVVADIADNAQDLLDRVKLYLRTYEEHKGVKVPLKYNSKYELVNASNNAKYIIGTANNVEFGRSKTITNLHLSEAAFYPNFTGLISSAVQAVVPTGRVVIETTANGFNELRSFWISSKLGETGFQPLFFKASAFYSPEFLALKLKELGPRKFKQEYPETPEEAFITSGDCFFDTEMLAKYLKEAKSPEGLNV